MSPDEIRRSAEAGTAALQAGDARTARKHFEQIVATGSFEGDVFIASSILMKCPSKYKNEEVLVRSNM